MPRLHLGMTFTSIKDLDPISIERVTRDHNIESGLIVEQVYIVVLILFFSFTFLIVPSKTISHMHIMM